MVIINKKRMYLLIICILLSIGIFKISSRTSMPNTIETVALPVSNKVIVIDAGHGKPDEGAESSKRNDRSRN